MGIFDSKSSSRSSTTNKQNTNSLSGDFGINFSDLNLSSNKGSTSALNLSLNVTDRGAVAGALDLGSDLVRSNERTFSDLLFTTGNLVDDTLDFGSDALFANQRIAGDAISSSERQTGQALGFAENLFDTSISTVERTSQNALDQVAASNDRTLGFVERATAGFSRDLTSFAKSQSTNNDERLVTIGKWAAGAAVVIVGLNAFFNRKRAA